MIRRRIERAIARALRASALPVAALAASVVYRAMREHQSARLNVHSLLYQIATLLPRLQEELLL
jgi:hypothetical protein